MVKNLLKQLLVPVLASRPVSGLATRLFGTGIPIFMLHRMVPDNTPGGRYTPSYLRKCLTYLRNNGYSFVSVEDIIASLKGQASLPQKPVAFTIDDGFYDQAELAAPVFIEFNCPVTVFLTTGMLDRDLWPWFSKVEFLIKNSKAEVIDFNTPNKKETFSLIDRGKKSYAIRSILESIKETNWEAIPEILDNLSNTTHTNIPELPPKEYKPMTWDMARELEKEGVKFGPHTVRHPILSMLSEKESQNEINCSWQRLKDELSCPSHIFCYPNGRLCDFGAREIDTLKNNGFLGALSTVPAHIETTPSSKNNLYALPRLALPASFHDFLQYCSWIEYAKEKILAKKHSGD